MNIADVVLLLGGVAMFLFGMAFMGDGLKKVAGDKLELYREWMELYSEKYLSRL